MTVNFSKLLARKTIYSSYGNNTQYYFVSNLVRILKNLNLIVFVVDILQVQYLYAGRLGCSTSTNLSQIERKYFEAY